jgi:hypothetical protein
MNRFGLAVYPEQNYVEYWDGRIQGIVQGDNPSLTTDTIFFHSEDIRDLAIQRLALKHPTYLFVKFTIDGGAKSVPMKATIYTINEQGVLPA